MLIFDYRGFGESEGSTDLLRPQHQLEDLVDAVTYLTTRDDIDADNIGACLQARLDERVRLWRGTMRISHWWSRMRTGRSQMTSRTRLISGAQLAEDLGFDSIWVRDHLVFEPHAEMDKAIPIFYEALAVGTMSNLLGPRLIIGVGAGTFDHEFEAIGMGGILRPELVESNARIVKLVFSENNASDKDDNYSSKNVSIEPKPTAPRPSGIAARLHVPPDWP